MIRVLHFSDVHVDLPLSSLPWTTWLGKRAIGGLNHAIRRRPHFVHAIDKLAPFLSVLSKPNWTGQAALPGGAFDVARTDARMREYQARWPFLAPVTLSRLFHAYGSDLPTLLGDAKMMADLGPLFGADLTAREVDYLVANEWARSADDILWRRTKLGLRFTSEQATALAEKLG